jgi:hypothetical protein
MPLDANSLCPGGTGKKIKFCCADFLPELQKLDRMLEGEQYHACLQRIEHLKAIGPGAPRSCLLGLKRAALHGLKRVDEHRAAAAEFLAAYPDNQLALAESVWAEAPHDILAAFALQQKAMRITQGQINQRTFQAVALLAVMLYHRNYPQAGIALAQLLSMIAPDVERVQDLLARLTADLNTPLLLRDGPPLVACPADAPWKARFDEAMRPVNHGDWRTAAELLTALAAEVPDDKSVWQNLAILRGRLADAEGCIAALRRYAELRLAEADGLEEAVEAEALALLLLEDSLGDQLDLVRATWTIGDAQRAQELLLSSPLMKAVPFEPGHFSDGETPPPKAAFVMIDRPLPESAEGLTLQTVPRLLGHVLLFGRETDRPARIEITNLTADETPAAGKILSDILGELLEANPVVEVRDHYSASERLLQTAWLPPRDSRPEQLRQLMIENFRQGLLEHWPELKLGCLGGRSPREAAGGNQTDQAHVLAAILALEQQSQQMPAEIDFNELRSRLGLPTLGPIDPKTSPPEGLPAWRLARLETAELSDEQLLGVFYHASEFNFVPALRKFAQAIVDRPSFSGRDELRLALVTLARTEEDQQRALEHVAAGRREAEAAGQSSATWDLMELEMHFINRDGPRAAAMLKHIEKSHSREPGITQAVAQMLVDFGLFNPDGTPAYVPGAAEEEFAAAEAAAEPGGLWTPDGAQSGGGGKLWTPD